MPIALFFSNHIEPLAEQLANTLYAGVSAPVPPFAAVKLVVPNRNLAKWLQLHLARQLGVSMNIDYAFLDTVLWELLLPFNRREVDPLPADQDIYTLALLRVLENLPAGRDHFDPVRAYLTPPGGRGGRISDDTRRWQLAARLAHLFLEYELNRPEWTSAWLAGRFEGFEMMVCQGSLYRQTLAVCDQLEAHLGRAVQSLPRFAGEVLPAGGGARRLGPLGGTVVNIFGLSQISTFHTDLIGRLASRATFRIFALNPSEAFWEDIRSPREKRRDAARSGTSQIAAAADVILERGGEDGLSSADDLFGADDLFDAGKLFDAVDHPLLSLWGKPGREHIRRLCELGDYDFQTAFASPQAPQAVLGKLQESFRHADADGPRAKVRQDTSLQVIACPGRLREVETVYQRILFYLERDPDLKLTDIAVLVPDMGAYKPVIDAVFQRSPRQLSYSLVDTLAETESHYGRGVLALLDLLTGRFTRAEVLGLMINPLFLARWSVDMDMVAAWAGWIEALNIYHSFDLEEKAQAGGHASPRYTWQQGLRRLRLGRIMETDAPLETAFKGLLPYADLESGDLELLERFCLAVESLHAQVVRLRRLAAVDPGWPGAFLDACADLLDVGPQAGGETAVQRALSAAFESLADFAHPAASDAPSRPISVDILRGFVLKHLRGLTTSHGEYLIGGVTVAALQPMRPIPFEIIFILGMQEGGGFPGRPDLSSLDLRLIRPKPGDVTTPERNNYLFLEALLSARRRLVISYTCRDLQRDRQLAPCAPVLQLKRFISDHLLEGDAEFKEQRVPLKASDPVYLTPPPPPPWADPLVNTDLLDRILALKTAGAWPLPPEAVPRGLHERVAELTLAAPAPAAPIARPSEAPVHIFVEELRRFLLNPIPVKLARHLGVRAVRPPIETLLVETDEPFASTFPTDFRIVRETLNRWLEACWLDPQNPPAVTKLFQSVYAAYARRGVVPEGVYEGLDRRRLQAQVIEGAAALGALVDGLKGAVQRCHRLVIGHTAGAAQTGGGSGGLTTGLPPLILSAAAHQLGEAFASIELSGELVRLWQDGDGAWHSLVLTGSRGKPPTHPNHHVIAPLLSYLAVCGSGAPQMGWEGGFSLHLAAQKGVRRFHYRIDPGEAVACLLDIIGPFLDLKRHRWLPFREVTAGRLRVQDLPPEEIDDRRRRDFLAALREAWDEAGDYLSGLARPRFDLACLDEARRRVAIFFTHEEA